MCVIHAFLYWFNFVSVADLTPFVNKKKNIFSQSIWIDTQTFSNICTFKNDLLITKDSSNSFAECLSASPYVHKYFDLLPWRPESPLSQWIKIWKFMKHPTLICFYMNVFFLLLIYSFICNWYLTHGLCSSEIDFNRGKFVRTLFGNGAVKKSSYFLA